MITSERTGPAEKIRAAERSWSSPDVRDASRAALERFAWDRDLTPGLRLRALDLLLEMGGPEATRSNRLLVRVMLPTEPDADVVSRLATAAAAGGWTDATDGLVRRLSRPLGEIPIEARPEAMALRRLHPDQTLTEIAYETFLRAKPLPDAPDGLGWRDRVRADAWGLLSEVDPSGRFRMSKLETVPGDVDEALAETLDNLRAAARDLRALPATEASFAWLASLRSSGDEHRAWWRAASSAAGALEQERAERLRLRHLEPIRWATANRSSLAAASRSQLLSELERRLEGRTRHTRRAEIDAASRARSRERLDDWRGELSWADVLSILVVDEALRDPRVVGRLPALVELDRGDDRTEYGGLIESGADGHFRLRVFPPRARDRIGDDTFVASSDLFEASDHALAHFHLQVQRRRNARFAGPSPGDMLYAERSGRTCVVLTSVREDVLNADVYLPSGVIIDLGELATPSDAR